MRTTPHRMLMTIGSGIELAVLLVKYSFAASTAPHGSALLPAFSRSPLRVASCQSHLHGSFCCQSARHWHSLCERDSGGYKIKRSTRKDRRRSRRAETGIYKLMPRRRCAGRELCRRLQRKALSLSRQCVHRPTKKSSCTAN